MSQFKCPLAWCKWRAGSPLFDFVDSRGGSQPVGCIDPDAGISPCTKEWGKHAFQAHYQLEHTLLAKKVFTPPLKTIKPMWIELLVIRHEVFALACEGIRQGAIAARVGLTRATFISILKRHAAMGSLVPGKSSGAPRKTTPQQDRALLRVVRQDRFLRARALTARMRNLYGMRAGRTTVNNRLLSHGYRAYRPTTKPLLTANHRRLRLEWAQSGRT